MSNFPDVHHHYHYYSDNSNTIQLLTQIRELLLINNQKLNSIMATEQELLLLLQEADKETNEIAADIQDLLDNKQVSQEVVDKTQALVDRLKGVAAVHTGGQPAPTDDTSPAGTSPAGTGTGGGATPAGS